MHLVGATCDTVRARVGDPFLRSCMCDSDTSGGLSHFHFPSGASSQHPELDEIRCRVGASSVNSPNGQGEAHKKRMKVWLRPPFVQKCWRGKCGMWETFLFQPLRQQSQRATYSTDGIKFEGWQLHHQNQDENSKNPPETEKSKDTAFSPCSRFYFPLRKRE